MAYRLKPLGNNVVVILEKQPDEKKTESGLILVEKQPDRPQRAEVVAVGPGLMNLNGEMIPMHVHVGDMVLINKHAPQAMELPNGEIIQVISEGDIAVILEEIPDDEISG